MYQFYYAKTSKIEDPGYIRSIEEEFCISAIRPTMWEEHCLECAAPQCFGNCSYYEARVDGRCKRFYNGIETVKRINGCCGQGARIKFRRWGNLMTIIFPGMATPDELLELKKKNDRLGNQLRKTVNASLPTNVRWQYIRIREYLRRRKLRKYADETPEPDAFVFHGYSFEKNTFRLIIEIYNGNSPVFKTSLVLDPGENLYILNKSNLSPECWKNGNLLKVYPENNIEAEIEILWADFVCGKHTEKDKPADKVKCVVWDLDNTFWDGILIETNDTSTLRTMPGVMETVKALDEIGVLQSVASKNDFDQAWPVIERMGVADYFLYPQINWGAKSNSIRTIAESMNIGVDTFMLIDDSAFERNQVRSTLPQVRVFDPSELHCLLKRPEFNLFVTKESLSRREMYRAEEKRTAFKANSSADIIEFLKKCNICITLFVPETEEEVMRCYELVTRTNQLNMSGNKYSREEFSKVLLRPNTKNFALSCEDDFGGYGIVGYGQYLIKDDMIVFTEYSMSCRVAGKYIESALFAALLEKERCKLGSFTIQKTKKNSLLLRSLEEIGFVSDKENEINITYRFSDNIKEKNLVRVINNM